MECAVSLKAQALWRIARPVMTNEKRLACEDREKVYNASIESASTQQPFIQTADSFVLQT